MAFQPPTFNLTCTIWRGYGPPHIPRPAGGVDVPCNLSTKRAANEVANQFGFGMQVSLLLPKGTDVRPLYGWSSAPGGGPGDVVEVPKLSGRFYEVWGVDDVGKGFLNEYRLAALEQSSGEPPAFPIP
jgi:hypothetical protein